MRDMKVLHIPYTYYPDVPGGTEVYVAALARELATLGTASVIAAPTADDGDPSYVVEGVPVHRLSTSPGLASLSNLYGRGDPRMARAVMNVVAAHRSDVVHFHAYTPAINGIVAKAVRSAGLGVVITYHSPTMTCQRGTLARFGHTVCDGRMIVRRCSACIAQQHGIPRPIADMVGHVPNAVGRAIQSRRLAGGVWTALQMTELLRVRHTDTRDFLGAADVVVAPSEWVRTLLIENGVNEEKIVLSRQGLTSEADSAATASQRVSLTGRPLRAVMLGRLDWTKGFHIPVASLEGVRGLSIVLDIFAAVQSEGEYGASLRESVSRDSRVRILPALRPADVIDVIREYDLVLVPSLWLETGPLVVLDAFAAGVPVVGSALGGISERVRDGVDGRLLEPGSIDGWRKEFQKLVADPSIVERWRNAIVSPRTMAEAAVEMNAAYHRVARTPLLSREAL
jgi:glycosyltransferase involved in cell wall biosynthesis